MIRLLRLEGWKGFSSLELALDDGATFIVARNGIGKTSFVQAAAWVLFGARTKIDPALALRRGHSSSQVEVTLGPPGGDQRTIRRTITPKKRGAGVNVDVFIDGSVADDDAAEALVRDMFGASPDDLARLAVLPAGSLHDYDAEKLHLRRYLCSLYGIDKIEGALSALHDERRSTAAAIKRVRAAARMDASEVSAAASAVDELAEAIAVTTETLEAVQQAHQQLQDRLAAVDRFEAAQVRLAAYLETVQSVAQRAADLVGAPVSADAIAEELEELLASADSALDDISRETARHQARRDLAVELLAQLSDADSDCPVCRRPLDEDHREVAESSHRRDITAADEAIAAVEESRRRQVELRAALRALQQELRDQPELPPDPGVGVGEARSAASAASARIAELAGELGELRQRMAQQSAILEAAAEAQDAHRKAVSLYRRELLVSAAIDSAQEVLSTLLAQRIDPLSDEIADRWKKVFAGGRGGVQVTSDGEIVLNRGGPPLSFTEMSAGERSVALITTRLLALAALNRRCFAVLDEPLEQLDPANRRIVALLLARAPSPAVPQIIATTFEEQLARRLEAKVPNVHLEFIAADD